MEKCSIKVLFVICPYLFLCWVVKDESKTLAMNVCWSQFHLPPLNRCLKPGLGQAHLTRSNSLETLPNHHLEVVDSRFIIIFINFPNSTISLFPSIEMNRSKSTVLYGEKERRTIAEWMCWKHSTSVDTTLGKSQKWRYRECGTSNVLALGHLFCGSLLYRVFRFQWTPLSTWCLLYLISIYRIFPFQQIIFSPFNTCETSLLSLGYSSRSISNRGNSFVVIKDHSLFLSLSTFSGLSWCAFSPADHNWRLL